MAAVAKRKRVGVLALQGDFEAHERALTRAGAEAVEVRSAADLEGVEGLVIPGGESTTMMKLLERGKPAGAACASLDASIRSLEPARERFCWLGRCQFRSRRRSG